MGKRIVLISCVSKKQSTRAKAKDLYTSTLFKLNIAYAHSIKPDRIYILSAEHGLLSLDEEIDPYDKTLNTMSSKENKEWAQNVLQQLKRRASLDKDEFIFLAGEKYRRNLAPLLRHYQVPLEGLRIGEQLQKLKALVA